jgi:predicted O-methyltransferase YrrM
LYSRYQLAKKYIRYYFTALSGKGHGIHSPFVYDFICKVLNDRKKYDCYHDIELIRKKFLNNSSQIRVMDFGAGSAVLSGKERSISTIASSSLKPAKYAQLLFRMVQYYRPKRVVELGTSLGTTAAYLASGNPAASVFTFEGDELLSGLASDTMQQLYINNVNHITGNFGTTLPAFLQDTSVPDFVFIDGNHQEAATLEYFKLFKERATPSTILVFDDIHWSKGMENAWAVIQQDPAVTLSIDLFFLGIIYFNADINHKQQFVLRF